MSKRTHDGQKKAEDMNFKLPNKEMILTRGKAIKMRRQLRIKSIPKSPVKQSPKSPKSPTKAAPKTVKVTAKSNQPKERARTANKVVLKPPQRLRKVEVEQKNKRKSTLPKKTSNESLHKSEPKAKEINVENTKNIGEPRAKSLKQRCLDDERSQFRSFADVIRLRERTEELTDEDLLEIVQCPSPVWWEDPPDERYDEDPIFVRTSRIGQKAPPEKTPEKTEEQLNIPPLPESKCEPKFLTKRSTLENVLQNLKSKSQGNDISNKSANSVLKFRTQISDSSTLNINNNKTNHTSGVTIERLKTTDNKNVPCAPEKSSKPEALLQTVKPENENKNFQLNIVDANMKAIIKKMHGHLPNIRSVTAQTLRYIPKEPCSQIKKVYPGSDSAQLTPNKSALIIDLSHDNDVEKGEEIVTINDESPVHSVPSSPVKEHDKLTEEDIVKDLESLKIPIAVENQECIVIDEEDNVDSHDNDPFLERAESCGAQRDISTIVTLSSESSNTAGLSNEIHNSDSMNEKYSFNAEKCEVRSPTQVTRTPIEGNSEVYSDVEKHDVMESKNRDEMIMVETLDEALLDVKEKIDVVKSKLQGKTLNLKEEFHKEMSISVLQNDEKKEVMEMSNADEVEDIMFDSEQQNHAVFTSEMGAEDGNIFEIENNKEEKSLETENSQEEKCMEIENYEEKYTERESGEEKYMKAQNDENKTILEIDKDDEDLSIEVLDEELLNSEGQNDDTTPEQLGLKIHLNENRLCMENENSNSAMEIQIDKSVLNEDENITQTSDEVVCPNVTQSQNAIVREEKCVKRKCDSELENPKRKFIDMDRRNEMGDTINNSNDKENNYDLKSCKDTSNKGDNAVQVTQKDTSNESECILDTSTNQVRGESINSCKNDVNNLATKQDKSVSRIRLAYKELIAKIKSKIKDKRDAENAAKLSPEKCDAKIISINASESHVELSASNNKSDNIANPHECSIKKKLDVLDCNARTDRTELKTPEPMASVQVLGENSPITYEIVTSEKEILESLRLTRKPVELKKIESDDDVNASDEEGYENINRITMSKEMIDNIIGIKNTTDLADPEVLEQIVLHGINPERASKKDIVIAQKENLKYCFKCSSIYDTAQCSYCIQPQKIVKRKEVKKIYSCDLCQYKSKKRCYMEIHALRHTKDKPYGCDHCKNTFKTKATLRSHLQRYCGKAPEHKQSYIQMETDTKMDDTFQSYQLSNIETEKQILDEASGYIVILTES